MKKRSNDFVVGLVVVVTTVLLVVATVWVQQSDLGNRQREITARLRDVGGIRVGGAVVVRGVRAGRVKSVELADDGWVHMTMTLERDVPLPAEPAALLSASSLFGEWQVTVLDRGALPRDRDVRRQIADASGTRRLVPGAVLPDIAQLTAVAGRIASDVAEVSERVGTAFDDRAARELRASIANFADLSGELARTVHRESSSLEDITGDVHEGVQTLNRTAASLAAIASRVDTSASQGELRQMVADAAVTARQLREASADLRATTRRLAAMQGSAEQLLARSDSVMGKVNAGEGSLGLFVNDPSFYRHGDSLLVQLQALVTDVKQHPKRYITVELF